MRDLLDSIKQQTHCSFPDAASCSEFCNQPSEHVCDLCLYNMQQDPVAGAGGGCHQRRNVGDLVRLVESTSSSPDAHERCCCGVCLRSWPPCPISFLTGLSGMTYSISSFVLNLSDKLLWSTTFIHAWPQFDHFPGVLPGKPTCDEFPSNIKQTLLQELSSYSANRLKCCFKLKSFCTNQSCLKSLMKRKG